MADGLAPLGRAPRRRGSPSSTARSSAAGRSRQRSGGHREAAVDHERLAGDELGVVAGEEHARAGEVLGLERRSSSRSCAVMPSMNMSGTIFFVASVIVTPGAMQLTVMFQCAELRGHELREPDDAPLRDRVAVVAEAGELVAERGNM